ncbi:hypothetical protein Tco_0823399, partial [Tanacetum coccineum]
KITSSGLQDLVTSLGASWDFLDQRFVAIDGYRIREARWRVCVVDFVTAAEVGHKEEMWLVLWPRNGLEILVSFLGMKDVHHQVSSLMAYFVAILTSDSTRSSVMQCTLPTEGMRSIISTVSVILEGFLPSILLLVMIIVAVVIVAVILVVVVAIIGVAIVVTIIGVVVEIMIIGVVVVVSGVSSIIKLSFVIIGFLHRITLYYLLLQPLSYVDSFLQSLRF